MCGYIYDEVFGDEYEGFVLGILFSQIFDDWCCFDCGVMKEDYVFYEEKQEIDFELSCINFYRNIKCG